MIPLRDSVPASRTPIVTYTMVGLCTLVFLAQLADPRDDLVLRYGMVPARVFDPDGLHVMAFGRQSLRLPQAGVADWLTLLTCTFLHGGWMHFLGNMWFLWIFGDNVEDRFGRLRFLLFYLGCGVAASAAHLWSAPDSAVPTVGASGAIAGVMGAYLLLYPHSRVQMLVIWGFFVDLIVLPAPFFLGYWFLLQLLPGLLSAGQVGGGVAWWAHIGGFVVGAGIAALLRARERLRPEPPSRVLVRQQWGRHRGPRYGSFGGR
ncbi:MAG: rhomboid family intramembrane serine protease [Planctomycetes bacterium]|nr:rhomboid family intramembrane serine protease [Planctomycetota bacterium]